MPRLADLFNESSQRIYNKFTPSEDQFVSINPGVTRGPLGFTKNIIRYDSQSLPVSSVIRDTIRISKLLDPRSPRGLLLLGKQFLLQTGNTFQQTRIYNPLSPLINVVPFFHFQRLIKRDLYPLLQPETITKLISVFGLTPTQLKIEDIVKSYNNTSDRIGTDLSRPEYKVFYQVNGETPPTGPRLYAQQTALLRGKLRLTVTQYQQPDTDKFTYATDFIQAAADFKRKFDEGTALKGRLIEANRKFRLKSSYLTDGSSVDDFNSPTDSTLTSVASNITDTYNYPKRVDRISSRLPDDVIDYANITTPLETLNNEGKTDVIRFIFSDAGAPNTNPVQFRAFLSSIRESIRTEFSEQRYIGRTERFVTYGGAKRGVNLSFNIVAFSENEVEGMWSRVNYLAGLAFPKEAKNGFMVPPLFNITVGNIYDNQPCYIENLEYDFLDETITFDIEREVPFVINVNMQLSILEKRTKFYNSPFYGISEGILQEQLRIRNQIIENQAEADRLQRENQAIIDNFARQRRAADNRLAQGSLRIQRELAQEADRQFFSRTSESPDAFIQRLQDENRVADAAAEAERRYLQANYIRAYPNT